MMKLFLRYQTNNKLSHRKPDETLDEKIIYVINHENHAYDLVRIDETIFIMDGTNECFNRDVQKEILKGYYGSTQGKANHN